MEYVYPPTEVASLRSDDGWREGGREGERERERERERGREGGREGERDGERGRSVRCGILCEDLGERDTAALERAST